MRFTYKRPLPNRSRIDASMDTDKHVHALQTRELVARPEYREYRCVCSCGWQAKWWHPHRKFALRDFEDHRDGRELPDLVKLAAG